MVPHSCRIDFFAMDCCVSNLANFMELPTELFALLRRYTTLNKILLVVETVFLSDHFGETGELCSFKAKPTTLSGIRNRAVKDPASARKDAME